MMPGTSAGAASPGKVERELRASIKVEMRNEVEQGLAQLKGEFQSQLNQVNHQLGN